VRPLVMKAIGPEAKRTGAAALSAAAAAADPAAIAAPARESQAARMIELAKVNGQVQQQSLERIGELVKGNPVESVSVLRQWIYERT
jgi:flagellar M-ring protein FliF